MDVAGIYLFIATRHTHKHTHTHVFLQFYNYYLIKNIKKNCLKLHEQQKKMLFIKITRHKIHNVLWLLLELS